MAVALIADAHLGGPGGEAGPLVAQLRGLPSAGCHRLILLGDVFHVWIGARQFETAAVRAVAAALRELRAGGIEVDYVEGNRDFFLAGSPYGELFDRLSTEVSWEEDGVRYLAVHGDGLNDRDRQYLFWRWLSKSPPVGFLVRHLPASTAHRFVHRTEKRLAATNFKHRRRIPEEAILRYAERRFAEGHEVLYLGHFHEPRTWRTARGEVRLLDAWFNAHHLEWPGRRGRAERSPSTMGSPTSS